MIYQEPGRPAVNITDNNFKDKVRVNTSRHDVKRKFSTTFPVCSHHAAEFSLFSHFRFFKAKSVLFLSPKITAKVVLRSISNSLI